jgi:hypothetical protein
MSAVRRHMIELAKFEIRKPTTKLTGGDCIDAFKRRTSLRALEVAMAELLALRAKVVEAERAARNRAVGSSSSTLASRHPPG